MKFLSDLEEKKKQRIEAEKKRVDAEYNAMVQRENEAKAKEKIRQQRLNRLSTEMKMVSADRLSNCGTGKRLILGLLIACKSPMSYHEFVKLYHLDKLVSELDKLDTTDYLQSYKEKVKEIESEKV